MDLDFLHWVLISLVILFVARVADLMELLSIHKIKETYEPDVFDGTDGY